MRGPAVNLYLRAERVRRAGLSKPAMAVYRQLVVMARPNGEVRWAIGDRQLVRQSGYSISSVRRARAELVDVGLVERLQVGTGRSRSRYALVPLTAELEQSLPMAVGGDVAPPEHPAGGRPEYPPPAGVDPATGEVLGGVAAAGGSAPERAPRVPRLNTQGGQDEHTYTRAGEPYGVHGPSGYHPPTPLPAHAADPGRVQSEERGGAAPPPSTPRSGPQPGRPGGLGGGCRRHRARAKPACADCRPTSTPIHVRDPERCALHGSYRADACGGCRADRLARPDPGDEQRGEEGAGRPPS